MSDKPKPYPKNVEGDFYVEDGCCITCLVPEFYAPTLMGFDETDSHCFVAKQPTNENEVYQVIKATWAAEVQCIRYGGQNPQILRRLAEAELADCCDQKHLIQQIKPLLRNHTTFEYPEIQSELEIANQFREYVLMQSTEYLHYKASKITSNKSGVTFAFSWYEENYYSVWFNRIQLLNTWHIFHSPNDEKIGSRGISVTIDEWLRSNKTVANIKWYTDTAWNKSFEWQETPI
jgi:hypothetical protein